MKSIDLVREFHNAFGQACADEPGVDDGELNALRLDLIGEELNELATALGYDTGKYESIRAYTFFASGIVDRVAVLDALTDLQYVLDGAYLSLGFAHLKDAALREVHRSNMSKLDEDGRPVLRDDGKILKGPNYSPPDLHALFDTSDAFDDEPPTLPPVPERDR